MIVQRAKLRRIGGLAPISLTIILQRVSNGLESLDPTQFSPNDFKNKTLDHEFHVKALGGFPQTKG